MKTFMRAIARSTTRWALAGLVSLAPAGVGYAQSSIEFFHPAAGASNSAVVISDNGLDQLRGRQLPPPSRPAQQPRKRVVLWDEARTAFIPNLGPRSALIVHSGPTGVSNLRRAMSR
jgi:hypothetical protein